MKFDNILTNNCPQITKDLPEYVHSLRQVFFSLLYIKMVYLKYGNQRLDGEYICFIILSVYRKIFQRNQVYKKF